MKVAFRVLGVFLLQVVVLIVASHLIGNPIQSTIIWRVPLGSCYGYDLDFRLMIGLTAASVLLALFLIFRDFRPSTLWSLAVALATLDILYAFHLKVPSPCF